MSHQMQHHYASDLAQDVVSGKISVAGVGLEALVFF